MYSVIIFSVLTLNVVRLCIAIIVQFVTPFCSVELRLDIVILRNSQTRIITVRLSALFLRDSVLVIQTQPILFIESIDGLNTVLLVTWKRPIISSFRIRTRGVSFDDINRTTVAISLIVTLTNGVALAISLPVILGFL